MFDGILVASIPQMHLRSEGVRLGLQPRNQKYSSAPTITPAKAIAPDCGVWARPTTRITRPAIVPIWILVLIARAYAGLVHLLTQPTVALIAGFRRTRARAACAPRNQSARGERRTGATFPIYWGQNLKVERRTVSGEQSRTGEDSYD